MCDKLVFDLAQEIEGSPNVFVRKDWINILDNQNQNYGSNQSVIDTSQLSNSNKYMSYREAYFLMPFTVTLCTTADPVASPIVAEGAIAAYDAPERNNFFEPLQTYKSADYSIGLKNWFGQIIHSFTLDYNGTTIIQQTPFVNMWNSFKLITSMSLGDIKAQGPTIGFFPDESITWAYYTPLIAGNIQYGGVSGHGTCNNSDALRASQTAAKFNYFNSEGGNSGFLSRQQLINFDQTAVAGANPSNVATQVAPSTYGSLIQGGVAVPPAQPVSTALNQLWKSYISSRRNQTAGQAGFIQYAITACVYLKHVHSFFNMCPLLKGAFMKMTMNLNNTTTEFQTITGTPEALANVVMTPLHMTCTNVSNPLGGINPLMIASSLWSGAWGYNNNEVVAPRVSANGVGVSVGSANGGIALFPGSGLTPVNADADRFSSAQTFRMNISVGARCLDQPINTLCGSPTTPLAQSVYLYIPAYTFNPTFESAYLSSPIKQIKYTDIYQYQVLGIAQNGGMINNLLTNGIGNVKSVLVLPFYSASTGNIINGVSNSGFIAGTPVWQSPFDPAGSGPTSPMSWLSNFNIQVSGQNAIYNVEKYNFEQFNNQLYGQNAVNGGLTDGITSGLVSRQDFDMEYCYYYVNIERMLPVEMSVPKSIQLIGQNLSSKAMDYYCFVEYGCEIAIDILTGARV